MIFEKRREDFNNGPKKGISAMSFSMFSYLLISVFARFAANGIAMIHYIR